MKINIHTLAKENRNKNSKIIKSYKNKMQT